MIRAPVIPYGCPSAIAPPCGIQLLAERIDAELAADREHLGGERLVQLHDVDVLDRHARLLQDSAHGADRTDSHDLRLDARDGRRDDPGPRLDAEFPRLLLAGDDDCGCTVVQRARVSGRDLAVRPEGRLELGELLERGAATGAVVRGHAVPRRELAGEEAAVLGGDRALL